MLLPAHGPIPADTGAALATALRRAQRLVDDPAGAVWYGARRIFAFALMIRDGIPANEVEPYLHARAWLTDAARLLNLTPEALATELVNGMLRGGAIETRDGRLYAAAEHAHELPRAGDPGERQPWRSGGFDVDVAKVVLVGAADAHEAVGLVGGHTPLVPNPRATHVVGLVRATSCPSKISSVDTIEAWNCRPWALSPRPAPFAPPRESCFTTSGPMRASWLPRSPTALTCCTCRSPSASSTTRIARPS